MNCDRTKQRLMLIPIAGMIFFLYSEISYAEWQIDVSRFRDEICRTQHDSRLCNSPDKVGSFATRTECNNAMFQYCGGRGDAFCMRRISCVGYDRTSPSGSDTPSYNNTPSPGYSLPESYDGSSTTKKYKKYTSKELQELTRDAGIRLKKYIDDKESEKLQHEKDFREKNKELANKMKGVPGNLVLKTGQPSSSPAKSSKLKLSIAEKAKGSKSIEDLGCIAYWSLLAAEFSADMASSAWHYGVSLSNIEEQAREVAGWGFDDWKRQSSCPPIKVYIPEVPAPVEANPQYKAYQYIVERIEKIYPEMISTQEKMISTKEKLQVVRDVKSEVIRKQIDLKVKETLSKNMEEKKKLEEEEKSLEDQAKALHKEASEMESKAKTYQEEVKKWRQEYDKVNQDPAYASKLIKNMEWK